MSDLEFEYEIPESDYCVAVKKNKKLLVIDCDGDIFANLPFEWNQKEVDIWYRGYENGYKDGERDGIMKGEYNVQDQICKALGIRGVSIAVNNLYDRISKLEDD